MEEGFFHKQRSDFNGLSSSLNNFFHHNDLEIRGSFRRTEGEHGAGSAGNGQSGTAVLYFVHSGIRHRVDALLKELRK